MQRKLDDIFEEYRRQVRERARSGAAGPHPHKNTKRLKTRATRKRAALKEW